MQPCQVYRRFVGCRNIVAATWRHQISSWMRQTTNECVDCVYVWTMSWALTYSIALIRILGNRRCQYVYSNYIRYGYLWQIHYYFAIGVCCCCCDYDICVYHPYLQISSDDGLPTNICHECLFNTESYSEFRENVMQCETRLHRFVRSLSEDDHDKASADNTTNALENGYDSDANDVDEPCDVVVIDPSQIYESDDDGNGIKVLEPPPETTSSVDRDDENSSWSTNTPAKRSSVEAKRRRSTDGTDQFHNVHFCQFCEAAYASRDQCLAHEVNDHDPYTPHVCNFCTYRCDSRATIIAHIKEYHEREKPFVCTQCTKKFGRRSDLKKHSISHTGVRPYACPKCDKSFSRNSNLTKHIRVHQIARPNVCVTCSKAFSSAIDLQRHETVHDASKKMIQCDKCPARFSRRDKLKHHERGHLRRELMGQANAPENMIVNLDSYLGNEYEHLQIAFNKSKMGAMTAAAAAVAVPQPPMSALKNALLGNPMKMTQSPLILSTIMPGMDATQSHSPVPQNGFPANPLPPTTKRKPTAKTARSQAKTFACDQCPKRFNKSSSLNSHRGVHAIRKTQLQPPTSTTAIAAFNCNVCPKSFKNKRQLDRHSVVHSGIKSFQCLTCFARFTRKDKLVRHEKMHEKEQLAKNASTLPSQQMSEMPAAAVMPPFLSNAQAPMMQMAPRPNFYINNESLFNEQTDFGHDLVWSAGRAPWFRARHTPFSSSQPQRCQYLRHQ